MQIYIVTIDGKAQPTAYTALKILVDKFTDLPLSSLREAFKAGATESTYAKENKLYRVSIAEIVKVSGRGGKRPNFGVKKKESPKA